MRRADRLFRLLLLLRSKRVATAAVLARELGVSPRTVYRDVRDLIGSGVPIESEAGVGYGLPRTFDLPPLMFDAEEIGALVLGARMVQAWGDAKLAESARSVLAKVDAVLPPRLRPRMSSVELFAPLDLPASVRAHLECFRRGIETKRKLRFSYDDERGARTERTVRPVCLAFWGNAWTASAWCEMRADFRTFRPDRMRDVEVLAEAFIDEAGKDLPAFLATVQRE